MIKRSFLVALAAVGCLLAAAPAASAVLATEINGIEITPGGRITAEATVLVRATGYLNIECEATLSGTFNPRLTAINQMTGALTRIGRIEAAATRNCVGGNITFRETPWDIGMIFNRSGVLLEREARGAIVQIGFLGVILGIGMTITQAGRRCEFRRKTVDFLYIYVFNEFSTGGINGSLRNQFEECGVRAELHGIYAVEPAQRIRVLLLNP